MIGITTEIKGVEELLKEFKELGENAIEELRDPSIVAANVILEKAKSKVDSDSGNLIKNLKITKPSKKSKSKNKIFAKVGFGKKAAYGVPLELGHRLIYMGHKTYRTVKERPFLRPAADESKDEVVKIMADAMNRILDESGRRYK